MEWKKLQPSKPEQEGEEAGREIPKKKDGSQGISQLGARAQKLRLALFQLREVLSSLKENMVASPKLRCNGYYFSLEKFQFY